MKFTYTETPGDQPNIHEWLAEKLKEHAKSKFGIDVEVTVTPIENTEEKSINSEEAV